ncbi:Alpha,alpha-trehalose-phosphate synthase [UDP-forming] A [Blattella germanica]|nr:Alpha,alpha-trehalose-phosphate synthase [UDP-forming] A [Blattella germanica]
MSADTPVPDSLIVVSNRLPFVLKRNPETGKLERKASAGGLVTAVAPVVVKSKGLWVGWPGHLDDVNEPIPESDPNDKNPTSGLLSEKAYTHANEKFADYTIKALHLAQKDKPANVKPIIWVHDYHLLLASNWIRQAAEDADLKCKLGFFLHIPFPPWDIFRLFPWADEVLQGMMDRKNLLVEHGGRTVRVRALPIGVPYDRFVQLAEAAPKVLVRTVMFTNQKIVLGVDRLDYTKGLVHRLKAFQRLLVKYPEHKEAVTMLQISVPSRTDVKEYQDLKEEMDQLVGRINGEFTTYNWSPIRYIYGCVSQDELAGFYRDSAVALVTPLRDGMNLVAKEFVACQINKPPGVLVVSPFAGAAETMHEALICNPYEIDEAAEVLHRCVLLISRSEKCRMAMGSQFEKEEDDEMKGSPLKMQPVTMDDFDEYLAE